MIHAEPKGPVGALEWTRRLRVGEARLVSGGFIGAGPKVLPQVPKARESEERYVDTRSGGGPSLRQQIGLMFHRPC